MRTVFGTLLVLSIVCVIGVAQESGTDSNLSDGRALGVGVEVGFPFGGLVSSRYWLNSAFGVEGILFLWGDAADVEGTLTARALYRIADASVVDFYGVAGATVPISAGGFGDDSIALAAGGGIEFGFRFAPALAWNLEFGLSIRTNGELGMLFGTGVHFYFVTDSG